MTIKEVLYTREPEDVVALARHRAARLPSDAAALRGVAALWAGTAALMAAAALLGAFDGVPGGTKVAFAALLYLVLPALLLSFPCTTWVVRRALVRLGGDPWRLGPQRMTLSPEGLTLTGELWSVTLHWACVDWIIRTD